MPFPPNNDRQRVLDATDLVRLVGEVVTLKPKGKEYMGICPFHEDHDPSLHVVPMKGFYKCFACGAGGSAFDFVMNYYRMDFREALTFLAERAGVTLTPWKAEREARGGAAEVSGTEIIEAHRTALAFYRMVLAHPTQGAEARKIFAERGISDEMIERFELGATFGAERSDALYQTILKKSLNVRAFEAAGLIRPGKYGSEFYDNFRNRLIFPIHDGLGRPIAFGARKINPEDEPKYLNSPDHPKFSKSHTLYALHLARQAIQKSATAIIVEGYTDVIACHQAGITNVVATLGTALGTEHARMLERLCDRVILIFDGDLAGQKAADRAVEIFFRTNVDVLMTVIPEELDPAELLAEKDGIARWNAMMERPVDALDFLLASLSAKVSDQKGLSARQKLLEAFAERIANLGFHEMNAVRRQFVVARLGQLFGLPEITVLKAIPRPKKNSVITDRGEAGRASAEVRGESLPRFVMLAQRDLVGCLLHEPGLAEDEQTRRALGAAEPARKDVREVVTDEKLRGLCDRLLGLAAAERRLSTLLAGLVEENELTRLATDLCSHVAALTGHDDASVRKYFFECLSTLITHDRGSGAARNERPDVQTRVNQLRAAGGSRIPQNLRGGRGRD